MRILIASCLLLIALPALADTTITYQGQLQDGGEAFNGAVDMSFALHEDATDDLPVGPLIEIDQVPVSDGLFKVELDFGDVFTGQALWLEASVEATALTPRQKITAVPMALNVPAGAGSNWQQVGNNIYFGEAGIFGAKVGIGEDNPSARLQVNGTMATGGFDNSAGALNTIVGGGTNNSTDNFNSFVIGGRDNSAIESYSGVVGGENNTSNETYSFVGGGRGNTTNGTNSFIGGGHTNSTNGPNNFVAGGSNNQTNGLYSFAAGHRAKALSTGTFVFADSTPVDFESTAADQFLVRAVNGIGLNTNDPLRGGLHVKQQSSSPSQIGLVLERGGATTNNWAFYVATSDNLGFRYNDNLVARIDTDGEFATLSDVRFKTDIEPIQTPLARLLALEPAQYRMKSGASDTAPSLGLIAQQVREVIPAAVSDTEDTLGISYNQITALNTAAIIELHAAVQDDRERMSRLQAENEALRTQLETYSAREKELRAVAERNESLEQRVLALESILADKTRLSENNRSEAAP